MASASRSELGERVGALIERFFGGNRTAAATTWRVPQATIQRLVVGDSQTCRATTLDKIASAHGTTVDWLMKGRGPDPFAADPLPYVEYRDFAALVDSLGLSEETRRAVLDLPSTTSTAHTILCLWGTMLPDPPRLQPKEVMQIARDAKYNAAALQFLSWFYLFNGLIKAYGPARVRDKLESEFQRIRLGFHPVPLDLMWIPEAKPLFGVLEARFKQRGGRTAPLLVDYPAIPSLDTVPPEKPRRGRPARFGQTKRGPR